MKGGWTNRYTSDYGSKFKINALVQRQFCAPIFWTSEEISFSILEGRITEYIFRHLHWLDRPKPTNLEQHLDQEIFVASNMECEHMFDDSSFRDLEAFYLKHQNEDDYIMIFNYFYGDQASESLRFICFGNSSGLNGFDYAKYVANRQA